MLHNYWFNWRLLVFILVFVENCLWHWKTKLILMLSHWVHVESRGVNFTNLEVIKLDIIQQVIIQLFIIPRTGKFCANLHVRFPHAFLERFIGCTLVLIAECLGCNTNLILGLDRIWILKCEVFEDLQLSSWHFVMPDLRSARAASGNFSSTWAFRAVMFKVLSSFS